MFSYIILSMYELILCMQISNPFEIYLGILGEIKCNLFSRIFSKSPTAYSASPLDVSWRYLRLIDFLLLSFFKYWLAY